MASKELLEIDGSVLEGGGQILRNGVAFSCLLGRPIKVTNIRASRSNPGLRPQHLSGIKLVAELCGGRVEGGSVGSSEVTFLPGRVTGGSYVADTKTAGSISLLLQLSLPCMVYANEGVCVTFRGGTDTAMAPPTDLYVMVALPCLLYADSQTQLTLKGGTNADMAPQVDFTLMVFQPIAEKFGMKFTCDIKRRGYYPKGGGEVVVQSQPAKELSPIDLTRFGEVKRVFGRSFVAGTLPKKIAHIMASEAESMIRNTYRDIPFDVEIVKEPDYAAVGNGTGIIIVAETTTGCLLAGSGLGKRGVRAEQVGRDAATMLLNNLQLSPCVDEHLQDQLIILMALACGRSKVRCGPLTLHTETAIHIAKVMTEAKFDVQHLDDGCCVIECEGIGLKNDRIQ